MELNEHSLRQMDEDTIRELPEGPLRDLSVKLLKDLKEARERLNQNSRNSSRPPGSDAPWEKIGVDSESDGDDTDDAEWEEDTGVSKTYEDADLDRAEPSEAEHPIDDTSGKADTNTLKRNPGKQPGAPGFGRQQQLPVTAYVNHRPAHCACCGQVLSEAAPGSCAYTGFYTLDIEWGDPDAPGLRVTNTQHLYYETLCDCGHLTREQPGSSPPDDALPGVALSEWRLVGPGLSALIVCLAYRMRLSRQRIVEFLGDWLGIRLSVGTVHNTIMESGRAALALEDALVHDLLNSEEVLSIDETSWRERLALLWLWVFTTRTTVVFWIAWRTAELLENVLGDGYDGWLMSDGYHAYRRFLKRCRCWAHLLRKARGLMECLDSQAQRFGRQTVDLLDTLMAAIRTAREDPPDKSLSQLYDDLLENYRLECERMRVCAHKKARALAVEMLNDWDAIFRVLDHPHLPLTNNAAEQALRHWVILRRICYGTKTEAGSRVFAILASVIETCRKRQYSPWRYLQAVIANQRAGLPALPLPAAGGSE